MLELNSAQLWRPRIGIIGWAFTILAVLTTFYANLDPASSTLWVVYGLGLAFGMSGAALMLVFFREALPTRDMLLYRQDRVLAFGLLGGALVTTISSGVYMVFQVAEEVEFTTLTGTTVLAPVSEDYIFVFLIFGSLFLLFKGLHLLARFLCAAIPSSLTFALWHYFAFGASLPNIITLLLGGLVLRWVFVQTQDLGATMLAHLLNNLIAIMPAVIGFVNAYLWVIALPFVIVILAIVILRRPR